MNRRAIGNTLETYHQDEHGHLLELAHSTCGLFRTETCDDRLHRKLKAFAAGDLPLHQIKSDLLWSRLFRGRLLDWCDVLYDGYVDESLDEELRDEPALSSYLYRRWEQSDYWEKDAEFVLAYLVEELGKRLPSWACVTWVMDIRADSLYLQLDKGYTLAMLAPFLSGQLSPIEA